jgi:hypothetical protein
VAARRGGGGRGAGRPGRGGTVRRDRTQRNAALPRRRAMSSAAGSAPPPRRPRGRALLSRALAASLLALLLQAPRGARSDAANESWTSALFAGQQGSGGHADGASLSAATFSGAYELALAFAPNNTLYVGDGGSLRAVAGGQVTTVVSGGYTFRGVCVDQSSGAVYVTCYSTMQLYRVHPGRVDAVYSISYALGAVGCAVDASGKVVVASAYGANGNRILRFNPATPASTPTPLAGDGTGATLDGAAAAARVHTPFAVAVDASGDVWFTDAGGFVRKVDHASGYVSTVYSIVSAGGLAITPSGTHYALPSALAAPPPPPSPAPPPPAAAATPTPWYNQIGWNAWGTIDGSTGGVKAMIFATAASGGSTIGYLNVLFLPTAGDVTSFTFNVGLMSTSGSPPGPTGTVLASVTGLTAGPVTSVTTPATRRPRVGRPTHSRSPQASWAAWAVTICRQAQLTRWCFTAPQARASKC